MTRLTRMILDAAVLFGGLGTLLFLAVEGANRLWPNG